MLRAQDVSQIGSRNSTITVKIRIIMNQEIDRTYRIVVIPENVGGWFWTLQDDAREIDGATSIDEQLRRT